MLLGYHLGLCFGDLGLRAGRNTARARWRKKIEFPSFRMGDGSDLIPDPNEDGCYRISGDVIVHSRLKRDLQFFIMINSQNRDKNAAPFPCVNASDDGCGGVGSWSVFVILDDSRKVAKRTKIAKVYMRCRLTEIATVFNKYGSVNKTLRHASDVLKLIEWLF